MNEYRKRVLGVRKKVSKLTLEEQRQLMNLYEDAIGNLSKKAANAKDRSLSKRWALDYAKELEREKRKLYKEIRKQSMKAVEFSAELALQPEEWFYKEVFNRINIDIGPHFTEMFSQVQKEVVEDIISGRIYKDHKTLSSRVWDVSSKFEKDMQYMINQSILERKSALELARDLEKFVKDPAKRPWSWGKVYPNLRGTKVDYNAQRLARTSINHAYQTSTIKGSARNPFVKGIEWQSAQAHGRTCELCLERNGQIFPREDVPLDHPNGLCTLIPHMSQSLDQVASELRSWLEGDSNNTLEEWYNEHGKHFALRRI